MRRGSSLMVAALAAAVVASGPAWATPQSEPGRPAVEVRASRSGFRPSSLVLRRGETTPVVLTSADGEHCFAVDELRIEKRIVPGRATRFDLAADKAGTYAFYCCLESGPAAERERGQLVVAE